MIRVNVSYLKNRKSVDSIKFYVSFVQILHVVYFYKSVLINTKISDYGIIGTLKKHSIHIVE